MTSKYLSYKFQIPRRNNPTGSAGISQSTPAAVSQGRFITETWPLGAFPCGLVLSQRKHNHYGCATPPECICPIGDVTIHQKMAKENYATSSSQRKQEKAPSS